MFKFSCTEFFLANLFCWIFILCNASFADAANPQGRLESYGTLPNMLRVIGWAYDQDDMNHKTRVHVYIGGTAGSSVPSFEIRANKNHNQFPGHGFDETVRIPTEWCGRQTVRVYALNDVGAGSFQEIGSIMVDIPMPPGSEKAVTKEDGWYQIAPYHDLGRVLDVWGIGTAEGTNLAVFTSNGGNNQKFYLQNRGNGYFSLKAGHCDLYITADGRGQGTNLSMRSWNGSDAQLFKLIDGGNGVFHIVAKVGANLNFDCAGAGRMDGNNVQLWTKENNSAWHKWKFTSTSAPAKQTSQSQRDAWVKTNGNNRLNLRQQKSTSSAVLEKLTNGSHVTELEQSGSWSKVRTDSGRIGYVASQYLSFVSSSPHLDSKIDAAMNYIASLEGRAMDFDGAYGAQCVDLIKYYYDYLGVARYARGNGKDYATNELPSGWNRIKGVEPQKGDILVYTSGGGGYGHVAIAESPNVSWHQNYNGQYVRKVIGNYKSIHKGYWGVIRPVF